MAVDDQEQIVLSFVAEHELVLADHLCRLPGVRPLDPERELRGLADRGLLRSRRELAGGREAFQVTPAGLDFIESDLPAPGFPVDYQHQVRVVWVWLAARAGALGEVGQVLSRRVMRHRDQNGAPAPGGPDDRGGGWRPAGSGEGWFGVAIGEAGIDVAPDVLYPDVMLETGAGWVPVHLQLAASPRRRLEAVLAAYGERGVPAVLCLVSDPLVGRSVQSVASRLGLSRQVHVQPVKLS